MKRFGSCSQLKRCLQLSRSEALKVAFAAVSGLWSSWANFAFVAEVWLELSLWSAAVEGNGADRL